MNEQSIELPKPRASPLSSLQHNDPTLPRSGDVIERPSGTWVVETVADTIVTLHFAGKTNIVKFIPFWAWREMYPVKYEPGKVAGGDQ